MTGTSSPPMDSPPGSRTTVDSGFHSRDTSLYGWVTWISSCTPASGRQSRSVHPAVVADHTDRGALPARHRARFIAHGLDGFDDGPDLLLPGRRGA